MEALVTYDHGSKRRLGKNGDGGYITIDGLEYDLFISCGISDDPSFDADFVLNYPKVPAYAFDGTVCRPPGLPETVQFIQKNIGLVEDSATTNLHHLIRSYERIFLKMDIEGHEWKWILSLQESDLRRLRQVVIEVHGLWDDEWEATIPEKKAALAALSRTHALVHVHGNNFGHVNVCDGVPVPWVAELTYVAWDVVPQGLAKNRKPFPQEVDRPNNSAKPDISLNCFPYVSGDLH